MKIGSFGYLAKEGVKNVWTNRTMSFASVCVLVSCLVLTGAAMLFSLNVQSAVADLEGENSITVYLDDGIPTLQSVQIGEEIKKIENIDTCEFIPKDEALQEWMERLGDDGTIFSGLSGTENPLMDAFDVSLKDLSEYQETYDQIMAVEGVQKVLDYSDVAATLTSLDNMVRTVCLGIVLLLGIVSLFILANTIRVTMFSRRLQISIMKSVGATNAFIRVPFVIEGIVIGVFSGIVASLILIFAYRGVMDGLAEMMAFTTLDLGAQIWWLMLIFVGVGIVFGFLGGLISIRRYLKKEGGEIVGW